MLLNFIRKMRPHGSVSGREALESPSRVEIPSQPE